MIPEYPTEARLDTTEPEAGEGEAIPNKNGANKTDRLFDPLSFLLGIDGLHVPSHGPLVICVDEAVSKEYLGIVETISKRLYRERVGGTPTALRMSDLEELCNEDRWIEAEGTVTTVALSETDWERLKTDKERSWTRIWNNRILNQLFAQEFGVLVLNRRIISTPGDHFPRVCPANPSVLSKDDQSRIARLTSGFRMDSDSPVQSEPLETFAQRFNIWQERAQELAWREIKADRDALFWDATAADDASLLHRRLKTFALRAMAEEIDNWCGTDTVADLQQLVQTEYSLNRDGENNSTIRADVYSESLPGEGAVAVEAETLFGRSRQSGSPRDALQRTITKYNDTSVNHLIVLVDPLTVITQARTLASVDRRAKIASGGPTLTLATVDFTTGQLRTVRSVMYALVSILGDATKADEAVWTTASKETPCIVADQ